jgi:hypothetical protein
MCATVLPLVTQYESTQRLLEIEHSARYEHGRASESDRRRSNFVRDEHGDAVDEATLGGIAQPPQRAERPYQASTE